MKIAVVAADGRVAKKVIAEALNRGHEVTAFGRHDVNETPAKMYIKKDILNLTREDLQGFDAVVDAFGTWTPETLNNHSKTLKHLADILSGTNVRLLVVGGAGSLYVDPEHTTQLVDTPDFPEAFKPLATAQGKSLAELRLRTDVKWTYISPQRISRPMANGQVSISSPVKNSNSTVKMNRSFPMPTMPFAHGR